MVYQLCIHCIIWTWIVYCTSESGENSILFAKRICHWMFLFQLFLLEDTANVASFRKGFQIWGSSFWRCIPTYVKFFEIFEGSVDGHFILIWPDHRGHKHLQKVNSKKISCIVSVIIFPQLLNTHRISICVWESECMRLRESWREMLILP